MNFKEIWGQNASYEDIKNKALYSLQTVNSLKYILRFKA